MNIIVKIQIRLIYTSLNSFYYLLLSLFQRADYYVSCMKMYASRSMSTISPRYPRSFKDFYKSFAYVPSWKIIKDLLCKYLNSIDKFETKVMQGVDGVMFKGDASHKVTKLVYVNTDEKVYHGLYTLMNEFGEVTGWWFIRTGKMEELENSIKRIKKRYEMNKFQRPEIVYSDRPEMDRSLWERIWPSLNPDETDNHGVTLSSVGSSSDVPCLSFPSGANLITVIQKTDECSSVINRIRECLDMEEGQKVLGFDMEWNRGNNPTATLQFSTITGHSFIFCLKGILAKK